MKIYRFILIFLLFSSLSLSAQKKKTTSPSVDQKYITSITWRNIGPFRGGRSCAVAGVPGNPTLFYFGATGGGVWRTTDAGNTWENISDGYFGGSIGAIAVSSSDKNVIYVGQGEETVRGNTSAGMGVWKSVDAGRTWEFVGLEKSKHIGRIRIHPKNPDIVFVAAMGDLYKDSQERGVFKSVDGGKTWKKVLFSDAGSGAVDLTFDPTNPRILYASTWTVRRTPYSLSSGGKGCKLFKSTDNGETWKEISSNPGFPNGLLGIIGVTVSPANPNRVWAMVENEPDGGLYRSDDGGAHWEKVNDQRDLRQRAWYYTRIYADTKDEEKVYVLNVAYHTSKDGGRTFEKHYAPHGDHHDLWIAPEDPNRMIMADDGGAQITFDGGENWTTYHNQPTAQFYRVTTDNHFPFRIYGGQQDNSSIRIDYRSYGNFIDEDNWETTAGGEAGHHAISPIDNDMVLGGEYGGLMLRFNHKNNDVQATNVWPNNPLGHGVEDMKYRFQWNYPLFFSKFHDNKLYAFSNHVHVSYDFGQSWETISDDLTTNDTTKQGPSGGPITKDNTAVEYYCTIFAAAEGVKNGDILWTGSDDGKIFVTQNNGKNWQDVTPKEMPEFTMINSLEADPFNDGGLYVAATRYKWGNDEPYLYYTKNFGKSWKRIDNGINRAHFTRVIRTDPNKEGLLFAGTEYGLYISFNNGQEWQAFQNNLPLVPITDLAIKNRHLIAATQGRSFWIADDLSPLYEIDKDFKETFHLFTPKPTYNLGAGYGGKSKTKGENHLPGAILNYYLDSVDLANESYLLQVKDNSGKVIRQLSSFADNKADKWTPKKGANSISWDLRVDGVEQVKGMILWFSLTNGPYVVPGNYTVEMIKIGADTASVPLVVLKDPTQTETPEELQEQFDFVISIRDKMNELNKTIKEIRQVRNQLITVKSNVDDEPMQLSIDSLVTAMTGIEEALYQTKNRSPQDPLNFPIRLNNKYGHLGALANIGFNAPTKQMYGVKNELEEQINAELLEWNLLKNELPALNKKLNAMEVPFLKVTEQ